MRIVEESSLRRAEIEQEHRIDFKESDRIRRQIIEDYGKVHYCREDTACERSG